MRRRVGGEKGEDDVDAGVDGADEAQGEAVGERRAPSDDQEMPRVGNVPGRVPSNAIFLGVTYLWPAVFSQRAARRPPYPPRARTTPHAGSPPRVGMDTTDERGPTSRCGLCARRFWGGSAS